MWKIFYGDKTTFSYKDGTPNQAPAFNVICIVQKDPNTKRSIMHGWDWYYFNDTEDEFPLWWGADLHGILDRQLHRLPTNSLLMGRTCSTTLYNELMKAADEDPEFRELLK